METVELKKSLEIAMFAILKKLGLPLVGWDFSYIKHLF